MYEKLVKKMMNVDKQSKCAIAGLNELCMSQMITLSAKTDDENVSINNSILGSDICLPMLTKVPNDNSDLLIENIRRSSLYPVVYVKDDYGNFKRIDNLVTERIRPYRYQADLIVGNLKKADDPFKIQIIESIEIPEEKQKRNVFVTLFRWFRKNIHMCHQKK